MSKLTPTAEQTAIITAVHGDQQPIKVDACAGSGKTSTLQMTAHASDRRGLFLTFGREAKLSAEKGFPKHVVVLTTHSLAFRWFFGRWNIHAESFRAKLDARPLRSFQLAILFGIEPAGNFVTQGNVARAALGCVRRYQQSGDRELGMQHVYDPDHWDHQFYRLMARQNPTFRPLVDHVHSFDDDPAMVAPEHRELHEQVRDLAVQFRQHYAQYLLKKAQEIWKAMIDPSHPMKIDPDTYLKLYQLSEPVIDYDYIMLDEAQDTSGCVIELLRKQTCQVIIIGDPHQQIYAWRGAVNAMRQFEFPVLTLSKSWRYGSKIAELARLVLLALGSDKRITGNEALPTEIRGVNGPHTIICRTNSGLLTEAFDLLAGNLHAAPDQKKTIRIELNLSLAELAAMLEDAHALKFRPDKSLQTDKLKLYQTWAEFCEDAKDDAELGRLQKLVEERGDECLIIADLLRNHENPHKSILADVKLITAHRSKGLEYDQVRLMDDFPDANDPQMRERALSEDEINLLYVALTRAKRVLQPNSALMWHIRQHKAVYLLDDDQDEDGAEDGGGDGAVEIGPGLRVAAG